MATNKNITMKQFNGTDYDTLYPKTKVEQVEGAYTQQQILADSTKGLFGLDSGAVPDDAFSLLKTLVSNAQTSADGKAKIEFFSYVGTGVFGGNNAPNTLTFAFPPKIVCVLGWKHPSAAYESVTNYDNFMIPTDIMSTSFSQGAGIGWKGNYGKISSDGKTIYWYSGSSAAYQLNGRDYTYYGFAIG